MDGPKFLDSFEGLNLLSRRERDSYIKGLRTLYGMGVVAGNELRIGEDRRIRRHWSG